MTHGKMMFVFTAAVATAAVAACGAVAVATNDAASARMRGKQVADKPKEKRAPESEREHARRERENRLKMILLSFGGASNTNNITFNDLDLTGWEEEEKKGEDALMAFLEKVWERADAKKLAEKKQVR